jgi:hypothetical protein
MAATDPLTPTMKVEIAAALDAREGRIANEPEVRLVAMVGKRDCKAADSARDTPGARVRVGTFE